MALCKSKCYERVLTIHSFLPKDEWSPLSEDDRLSNSGTGVGRGIIDNGKVFEGYLLPLSQGAEGEGLIGYTGVLLIRDASSLNFFSEGKRRRLLGAMAHETMGMCTITVTATLMVLSISLPSVLREIVDPLDQVDRGSHSLTLIPSNDQAIAEAFEKLSGGIL